MSTRLAASLGAIMLLTVAASTTAAPRLTPEASVAAYCAAWNSTNPAERNRLLDRVFAPDGVYTDPTPTYVKGRAALSAEIAKFHSQYPGASFTCSVPQTHHNAMRVSWLLSERDGKKTEGMDFYELGADGLIRRATGFFGPPPTLHPR